MADDQVREILERPIDDLVALGLQGGVDAATRMIAFQMIFRLELAGRHDLLEELRDEINDALTVGDHPPPDMTQ
jgi:hypothetical protein